MAAPDKMTFDRHLRHAFAPLSARLESGVGALDGMIEMLRLRIEAEATFAASLQKILTNNKLITSLSPVETLRKDGLDALHADMKNEHMQRLEFLNSLNEDVYQPMVETRELYAQKNRTFASDTKSHIKALRNQQTHFYKIKQKYEKVCKDASSARTALLNAKLDSKISSQQILKLGAKVNSTLKAQQSWKEKYDQEQLLWNRHQIKFDDEMTNILQGMQSNEFNRMSTSKDSMNKWAVFVTNLCANRNYDVKNLAESMSLIDIDADLQLFIKETLSKHPPKNPHGPIPPHHQLHYGKQHSNALNNLNKASSDRNHDHSVDTKKAAARSKHRPSSSINHLRNGSRSSLRHAPSLHHQPYSSSTHNRGASASVSSFSSFGGSSVAHLRRGSGSVQSYSGPVDHEVLQKRNIRQVSTPNSLGGFFKNKFQKQRSYNSQRTTNGRDDMHHHERSNTISSYHESGVYPPVPPEDEEINTPNSQPLMPSRMSSGSGPIANGMSYRATSMSPGVSTVYDADIVPPPILSNDKHGLHLEMNHPIKPNSLSARMVTSSSFTGSVSTLPPKSVPSVMRPHSDIAAIERLKIYKTSLPTVPQPPHQTLQGPITTEAVPHRQTFPIFDSLSTLNQPTNNHLSNSNNQHNNSNHPSSTTNSNNNSNHSHSRSAPHHPHLHQRFHPQSAHPRDRHSDPLDARALDPLLNRRDHQNTSLQNQARMQRSIQGAPHSILPRPGRSPPLRKIPSASILDSEPKTMSPLPPSKHSTNHNHQLHAQGTANGMTINSSNQSSQRSSLVEPVPREHSVSHSPSPSYNSNRGTSPIPPPMSSCSPNPNSSSFIANPSPLPPNTPPHPDCHDPAQLQLRSPATNSNPTSLTTPSPPIANQALQQQQQLPQHHQPQLSDSVSMPSPQIQPPRPTPPAQRQQNGVMTQNRPTGTGSRRSSKNNLPQQIIIFKKKRRRTPSPHSRSHSRSRSRSRSYSRSPSGSNHGPLQNKSIVKPQTAEKAVAMMTAMSSTATPNHNHNNHMVAPTNNMVPAYNTSSDDGIDSSGGSTPILSDGDTSSIEVVVEPIQPKHGIIYEDEQNQGAVAKRDTPVPVDHKKSKYDDNLDFAANQGAKLMSQKVSESEDAEYDPLD